MQCKCIIIKVKVATTYQQGPYPEWLPLPTKQQTNTLQINKSKCCKTHQLYAHASWSTRKSVCCPPSVG